ncbi:hypothetical protein B0T24DRAFT_610325 [Lasiosphaeria ovina]|uniref:Uncharacterized protein n=1 Tax=Lasiosphaeria ovina TaxID=92902 RepID=A0AAE0NCR6_9PEZI|nr:hypothetical protein B0T24DRAFT_610325 [Lasiosphaeria ovina]
MAIKMSYSLLVQLVYWYYSVFHCLLSTSPLSLRYLGIIIRVIFGLLCVVGLQVPADRDARVYLLA